VHLFFAPQPAAGPPDLDATFWQHWQDATLPADFTWQRAAAPLQARRGVSALAPLVARFEWAPPRAVAERDIALLALCESSGETFAAGTTTTTATLIQNEHRAALRSTSVSSFVPDVFIRDGSDDDGSLGSVAWGGRSPDIVVVQTASTAPERDFGDLFDQRPTDKLKGGTPNFIYVRVHNRKSVDTEVDVQLFSAPGNALPFAAPDPPWTPVAEAAAGSARIVVPGKGVRLAAFSFIPADPDPALSSDPYRAYFLFAVIKSRDGLDFEPIHSGGALATLDQFWRFFRVIAAANHAAMRSLRFEPAIV
jgi:hypothetical protein